MPYLGWDPVTLQQTVTVQGVKASERDQLIVVRPSYGSIQEYSQCNVMCIQQLQDALVFRCDTMPQNDLTVFIGLQEISLVDKQHNSHIVVSDTEPTSLQINTNDFWVQPYE